MLGAVKFTEAVADRYTYLPCLAFAALAGAGFLALRRAAGVMMGMMFLQIFLGISAYMARAMGDPAQQANMLVTTVAHVAGGGLTLASTILLSIHILRNVRNPARHAAAAVTS